MNRRNFFVFPLIITLALSSCGTGEDTGNLPGWAISGFARPENANPVIRPDTSSVFYCPMNGKTVRWEESDTFNPAAVVKDGEIVVLYRAEDNSGQGIGSRTSRIGYAATTDGIHMEKRGEPVLYPADDDMKDYDWPGGCEDPRVAMTPDGMYLMLYTSWNRQIPRLCVATSYNLTEWEKHGPAFGNAYGGRFVDMASKSASILTEIKDGKLQIAKFDGKYFMYWGEQGVYAAVSEDLINWTPVLDEKGDLMTLMAPREGYFDSMLTECGPPAVITGDGIVLMYNGKNNDDVLKADSTLPLGTYSAGQALFDKDNPLKLKARLDKPFFKPEAAYEKSGQYVQGTVFIEGLVLYGSKWYLYYGCADSMVSVAVADYVSD